MTAKYTQVSFRFLMNLLTLPYFLGSFLFRAFLVGYLPFPFFFFASSSSFGAKEIF